MIIAIIGQLFVVISINYIGTHGQSEIVKMGVGKLWRMGEGWLEGVNAKLSVGRTELL